MNKNGNTERTLGELARLVEGELRGDPAFRVTGVAGLEMLIEKRWPCSAMT